jgi:hypothetical protein
MIKFEAESEMSERGREESHRLIEFRSSCKMGEGERK